MSRVFDISDDRKTTEATERQVKFLRAFLFDKTCTDEDWQASIEALLITFGQQLLKSDDPVRSIDSAIEMLRFMRGRALS